MVHAAPDIAPLVTPSATGGCGLVRFFVPRVLAVIRGLAVVLLCGWWTGDVEAYPLTQAQRDRLTRFVPKALEKLERRQPFHVVLVGDGVSRMVTRDESSEDVLASLHGQFLAGLEAEFYYTGGVSLVNPVGDRPTKSRDHKGEEITFEQFTEVNGTVLTSLRNLTSRALLNQPDLVIIHAGVNDHRQGMLLDTFGRALEEAVRTARAGGAEVIVVGPTLVRDGESVSGWGPVRIYTAVARQVAERAGVMFLDPGLDLARTRPIPDDGDAAERAFQISAAMTMDLFDYGPGIKETVHINPQAHRRAGRGMFQQFLNGVPPGGWDISASGQLVRPREMEVTLLVTNTGDRERRGVLAALGFGPRWEADTLAHQLDLGPGETKELRLVYRQRPLSGEGEAAVYDSFEFPEGMLSCPLLVSDLHETHLVDATGVIGPVRVAWNFLPQPAVRGTFPVIFWLHNPGGAKLTGSYELIYANQRARVNFELAPQQSKEFSNQCSLPRDASAWQARSPVSLTVNTSGGKSVFEREIEVTRNARLGQVVPLYRELDGSGPADGKPTLEVSATADTLDLSFGLGTVEFQEIPGKPSLLLEVSLDGRPTGESRGLGFVAPLQIGFSAEPGPGRVAPVGAAAFGPGYHKELSAQGIFAKLVADPDGSRRIEVTIPRLYIYRHGWELGDTDARIGLLARLNFARRDANGVGTYPPEARWANGGAPLTREDAAALPQVELAPGESDSWSVRLY